MKKETLNLEEYRCRQCRRLFYIDAVQRTSLDIDFGCPYGCDDNGERVRSITVGIEDPAVRHDVTGIKDHQIMMELCEGDFEQSMHRKPRDQEEFDEWACLAEKGLLNGHIDWDIIYECTREAMPGDQDE